MLVWVVGISPMAWRLRGMGMAWARMAWMAWMGNGRMAMAIVPGLDGVSLMALRSEAWPDSMTLPIEAQNHRVLVWSGTNL